MCSQKDLKVQKQAKVDISRVVVMNGYKAIGYEINE